MKYTNKAKLYLLAKCGGYEEAKNIYSLSKILVHETKTNSDHNLESIVND